MYFQLSKELLLLIFKISTEMKSTYVCSYVSERGSNIILTGGIPLSIQCCIKLILSTRSLTQAASGLSDG